MLFLLAAPLRPGSPVFSLRLEGAFGQPTTLLPVRGGVAFGAGYQLTDQLSVIGDLGQRVAPGGGIGSLALGLAATLDSTPVSPFIELAVVEIGPRETVGYSLATRTGAGVDWHVTTAWALGVVLRTLVAMDPVTDKYNNALTTGGTEACLRLVYTPGAK